MLGKHPVGYILSLKARGKKPVWGYPSLRYPVSARKAVLELEGILGTSDASSCSGELVWLVLVKALL